MRTRSGKDTDAPPTTPPSSAKKPRLRGPPPPPAVIPGPNSNANWSSLPDDLLELILQRLGVSDYVRFGAVCNDWYCIFGEKRHPPAQDQPWLWYPEKGADGFFCLSEERWYRNLRLPSSIADWRCYGSQHGWLIFLPHDIRHQAVPFLVNPFSGVQIHLPKIPARNRMSPLNGQFYFTLPPDGQHCVVLYIQKSGVMRVCCTESAWRDLSFYGDKAWRKLSYYGVENASAIVYKGTIYVLTRKGELRMIYFGSLGYWGRPIVRVENVLAPPSPPWTGAAFATLPLIEHEGELLMCCYNTSQLRGRGNGLTYYCRFFKANFERRVWEEAEILGSERLITSDYWGHFMPVLKKKIKSRTRRLTEGSNKYMYHCLQPNAEVMLSPRL